MTESSSNAVARTRFALPNRRNTLVHALLFVLGFSAMFVIVWGGDIKAPLSFTPSTWPIPLPPPGLGG